MTRTLSAGELTLSKIFCRDYEFRIPGYQRPYRWGADQALQLLDDLEETLERGDGEPYFLGSLVLVENGGAHHDVIDGQQRLTTLSLLFAVLRDLAESPNVAKELGELVLEEGREIEGVPARPRLTPRDQERDFFAEYVQQPGRIPALIGVSDNVAETEPMRAIRENARVLYQRLGAWDDTRRRDLATLALTRTYLVVVSTPNLDSAYRIFSVMNSRGLDLSPTDIFKSRVIGKLPPGSDHGKRWENAEDALGADGFLDLFRDIRTIVSGERARKELLREFQEQVLDGYLADDKAEEFMKVLLLPYGRAFERTLEPTFGSGRHWDLVNRLLRDLGMIDNKDWRPPALWALKTHHDDERFLVAFLAKLERLAASLLLRGVYSTPRVGRYLELLGEIKDGAGLDAPSFALSPEEKRASREALDGEIYRMQTRRARFVLLRLDALLAQDPGATYNQGIVSIEHVLPQNPAAGSAWLEDFTEDEREHWTHRLGNLLLLNHRKNSQARNFEFAAKKSRYFTSSTGSAVFALTTQVLGCDEWTPAVVAERQRDLCARLTKEWDLD